MPANTRATFKKGLELLLLYEFICPPYGSLYFKYGFYVDWVYLFWERKNIFRTFDGAQREYFMCWNFLTYSTYIYALYT